MVIQDSLAKSIKASSLPVLIYNLLICFIVAALLSCCWCCFVVSMELNVASVDISTPYVTSGDEGDEKARPLSRQLSLVDCKHRLPCRKMAMLLLALQFIAIFVLYQQSPGGYFIVSLVMMIFPLMGIGGTIEPHSSSKLMSTFTVSGLLDLIIPDDSKPTLMLLM